MRGPFAHVLSAAGRIHVVSCSRCDGAHRGVKLRPFARPIEDAEGVWTHWVRCPATGDPLLLQMREA